MPPLPVPSFSSTTPFAPPPGPTLAGAAARTEAPRRVAVLRALMLGDLLCATPALRALRRGWPQAHITLVGLPWARALAERLPSVDAFVELPGWPGLPERPAATPDVRRRFLARMQSEHFDMALQMHGSGAVVNPLVAAFGAACNAGFTTPGALRPAADAERFLPWFDAGTEVERLLRLTRHLGLPDDGPALDFPVTEADRRAVRAAWPQLAARGYAVVHAGSQWPSRRWPPARFAALADALAGQGLQVVLTGTEAERGLTREVAQAMQAPALDLAGATTLWTLGALVESARVVVCNDTGLSHVAAALHTPSLVLSCGGDALRWAPADAARHRVLWEPMPCRPCALATCPTGHGCATALGVEPARTALRALLAETARHA